MTILRDRAACAAASDADLLETYRAMTGKLDHPGFSCREALELQASHAILAGQYAAEQLGVPKDMAATEVSPLTLAEVTARVTQRSDSRYGARAVAVEQQRTGTIDMTETKATKAPKAEGTKPGRKTGNPTFKLTGHGTTSVRASSARGQLMAHIETLPNKKATLDELNAKFERNTLGDCRVLVRLCHLEEVV